MTYGNYAPFYRGGYFNPTPMQTQTMPNMAETQNQFAQPYQAPMQPQQMPMQTMAQPAPMPTNDMLWVLNETEATSYPVAPNNSVTLWDKNQDTVYIKSVNMQGVPSMRILDYIERTAENAPKTPEKHVCQCGSKFVPINDFKRLESEFEALRSELDELKVKPKAKIAKKAVEEVNDGE